MTERETGRQGRGRWTVSAFMILTALHVLLVLRVFTPSVLLRGDIPLRGDVSRYFASTVSAAGCDGVYGYDPDVMAGYPAGLWNSMGKKAFEVFHWILPWLPLPTLFYLLLTGFSVLAPFALWLVGRGLLRPPYGSLLLWGVCLVFWHLSTQVSYFWSFGNVFFPAATCLLPVVTLAAWKIVNGRRCSWLWIFAGVATAVAVFYFHTSMMAAVCLCLVACIVVRPEALKRGKVWGMAAAGSVLFLAAAGPWLLPLLRTWADYRPLVYGGYQGTLKHLVMDVFSDRVYGHPFDRNFLFHVAVVFGFAGAWSWRKDAERTLLWVMGVAALLCLVAAYSFSHVPPLRSMQPYRFLVPATLLLVTPAAAFLQEAWDAVKAASKKTRTVALLLALLTVPAFTAYLLDLAWSREACGMSETRLRVLQVVRHVPVRGRVLCDDVHLAHLVPYMTGRAVIGGLSAEAFVKHGHAGMDYEGRLFGRFPLEWDPAVLETYLAAYGIDLVVFGKQEWIDFAEDAKSPFVPDVSVGGYRLYRLKQPAPSLVMDGQARVTASHDCVQVRQVTDARLVLKLHYADWLEADHGVKLEPVSVLDDPVPFIRCRVPEGVTEFTITPR